MERDNGTPCLPPWIFSALAAYVHNINWFLKKCGFLFFSGGPGCHKTEVHHKAAVEYGFTVFEGTISAQKRHKTFRYTCGAHTQLCRNDVEMVTLLKTVNNR
jgi:hypothetical protein